MTRRDQEDTFASRITRDLTGDDRRAVGQAAVARRLLAAATRLLPAAERARYLEELAAELDDITATGCGRRAQAVYAARQLASAWRLRSELRARANLPGAQSPSLTRGIEREAVVVTESMTRISAAARNISTGSIGITGPRGVGKSTILQFFCAGPGPEGGKDLALVVAVPADYDPREFLIHLFRRLCEAVPHGRGDRSAIAAETRRHLEDLQYLREDLATLPELAVSFRSYSGRVAAWHRLAHGDGARVVIAIDEIDKIRDSDRAEAFLSTIKAVFGVPGCLYVMSLSDDVMAGFTRGAPSTRGILDSALDQLVWVGPMTYHDSHQLLLKRATGLPGPYLALCHVLASGVPRDLVRTARALTDVTPATSEASLPDVAGNLVRRDLEALRQASARRLSQNRAPGALVAFLHDDEWPGATPRQLSTAARRLAQYARDAGPGESQDTCRELATALSFYATVLEVFGDGPAQEHLAACLKEQRYATIDALAAVRNAMRFNTGHADQLLDQFRAQNGLDR